MKKDVEKRLMNLESNKPAEGFHEVVQKEICRKSQEDKEEEALIESKKNNIIYFQLPENDSESTVERMKSDFDLLMEAHDPNVIKSEQIKTIFRVGNKNQD